MRETCRLRLLMSLTMSMTGAAMLSAQQAPPSWAGWIRCVVTAQAPGYTDQQTHTWIMSGGAPRVEGVFTIYPATWSVVGSGSLQRTTQTSTTTSQWAINGQNPNAPVAVRGANGPVFFSLRHGQLRAAGGITGYRRDIVDGKPQPTQPIAAEAYEWPLTAIEENASTRISGSSTVSTSPSTAFSPQPGTSGTASCTWEFGQGAGAPAPAPTLTAQATPTPPGVNPTTLPPPVTSPPASSTVATNPPAASPPTPPGAPAAPSGTTAAGARDLGQAIANVSTSPPITIQVPLQPSGAYTDQWWRVVALDNPTATTAQLQFVVSLSQVPAGQSYDVEISEQTPSGLVTRSLSGTSQTPSASIVWPNVAGRSETTTFLVRVRQASGGASSGTNIPLALYFGGPVPSSGVPGVSGTTSGSSAAPAKPLGPPPAATVATSGTYRVTITGLAVGQSTGDGNADGAGDEVYIAVHSRLADRRMFTSAWLDTPNSIGQPPPNWTRSATFGDASLFPSRTRLGSASATGGLRTNDDVTLPRALVAWEGTLRDGVDVVFIKPSVWEDDANVTDFNQWVAHNDRFVGLGASTISAAASATSLQFPTQGISVTGVSLVQNPVFGPLSTDWPGDRPVGVGKAGLTCTTGNCSLPPYYGQVMVLSRENVEGYLTAHPTGMYFLLLQDLGDTRMAGSYSLTLKVERVP